MIYEMIIMRFPRLTVQSSSLIPAGQAVHYAENFPWHRLATQALLPDAAPSSTRPMPLRAKKGLAMSVF